MKYIYHFYLAFKGPLDWIDIDGVIDLQSPIRTEDDYLNFYRILKEIIRSRTGHVTPDISIKSLSILGAFPSLPCEKCGLSEENEIHKSDHKFKPITAPGVRGVEY